MARDYPRLPVRPCRLRLAVEQAEQGDADRAGDDRRIGDVERRPVVVAPMPLDEIDHVAVQQAVDDVAERAADHQRERQRAAPVAARRARQPATPAGR